MLHTALRTALDGCWKEQNIGIPSDEIKSQNSGIGQDDKLQICKVPRWKIPFPQSSKKVIMTSSFDKNNLGKESFALGNKIHRNKRKMGYQDYRREHT